VIIGGLVAYGLQFVTIGTVSLILDKVYGLINTTLFVFGVPISVSFISIFIGSVLLIDNFKGQKITCKVSKIFSK
jgi:hypothetical protein